jgi:hypothetical protein
VRHVKKVEAEASQQKLKAQMTARRIEGVRISLKAEIRGQRAEALRLAWPAYQYVLFVAAQPRQSQHEILNIGADAESIAAADVDTDEQAAALPLTR